MANASAHQACEDRVACRVLPSGLMAHNRAASVHPMVRRVDRAPAVRLANGTAHRPRAVIDRAPAIATMMTRMTAPAAASVSGAAMKEVFELTPQRPSRNRRNCR
jgi:hypothetical protein